MRYVQKRYVKPTKVSRHKRTTKSGKKITVKPYKRRIKRVQYGYKTNKSMTNAQYRKMITKQKRVMSKDLPSSDADGDRVRNWDDCRPYDKNRQDEYTIIVDYGKPYDIKVGSEKELIRELQKLREQYEEEPDDYPYFDIIVEDKSGKDVTNKVFKKYDEELEPDPYHQFDVTGKFSQTEKFPIKNLSKKDNKQNRNKRIYVFEDTLNSDRVAYAFYDLNSRKWREDTVSLSSSDKQRIKKFKKGKKFGYSAYILSNLNDLRG